MYECDYVDWKYFLRADETINIKVFIIHTLAIACTN